MKTIERESENIALKMLQRHYDAIVGYIQELGLKEVYSISTSSYDVSVQTTYDDLLQAINNTSLSLDSQDVSDDECRRLYVTINGILFVGYERLGDD